MCSIYNIHPGAQIFKCTLEKNRSGIPEKKEVFEENLFVLNRVMEMMKKFELFLK